MTSICGTGSKGKVLQIQDWTAVSPRSGAYVVWDNGVKNLYRLGFEGMSDIKVITDSKGPSFYRDHLPLLGEDQRAFIGMFSPGDHVTVELELEIVKNLQIGHGGWSDGMMEVMNAVGVVRGIDEDHDVIVQYSNRNRWTLNPAILKKVPASEERNGGSHHHHPPPLTLPPSLGPAPFADDNFQVGDFVKISSDVEKVKEYQEGHGDWVDSMIHTLGKVGRVIEVYSDGDLKIDIRDSVWTFNSRAVRKVDNDGVPLTPSTSANVSQLLRHMLEEHQSSSPGEEMVRCAASGDLGRVEELVRGGDVAIDNQYNGHTALQAASQNGHIDVVRCLLRNGSNLEEEDKDGDRAVHHASFGDEPDIVDLLAQHAADLNARNKRKQTPLHVAVNKGHVSVIRVLLLNKCHCSLQDSEGDTPLHDAISKKRDDMVALLLEGEADITVANNNGFNCLHHAALRGNIGALRLLLPRLPALFGVNDQKDDGFTALHLAALNNHLEASQALLQAGANPDAQNVNLQTPLHLAVERRNIQIVRLLVEAGANSDVGDKFGDRPLHEALRHHTMSQLKQLKESPQDLGKAMVTVSTEKKASASIAIFLASTGASLKVRNKKNQTPLELCSDPKLLKLLEKCHEEHSRTGRAVTSSEKLSSSLNGDLLSTCLMCQSGRRAMLLLPCAHVATCDKCDVTTCPICSQPVTNTKKIEECLVCSESPASVLFKPCLHMVACDSCSSIMKKCVQCRTPIETAVPLSVASGGRPIKVRGMGSRGSGNIGGRDVAALQQQLQEMKDKTQCQVCMDRRKNCVFLCGHGTCQLCADMIVECPICRKPVAKKIILFD
jgi:E3 ubiquitin-protein ligase mind-bomb